MDAQNCRERAQVCRESAALASGELRQSFLSAAETWEQLASQLERLDQLVALPRIGEGFVKSDHNR